MRRGIICFLVLGIFLIGIASAATYCCEKTTNNAWCQSVSAKTQCNQNFQVTAAYCEATSYCKTGTCVNQKEGTCSSSSEAACTENGGHWFDKSESDLPQCKLGCCLMGSQVAFVTQTNCNRLASLYGLTINFKPAITDELTCLASANPDVKGACVYTKDYVKTCELTTKKDCQDKAKMSAYQGAAFHEDYLCSAPELETVCGMSKETRCEGDDVYFVDTCGNLANIYDASKVEDENYWKKIQNPTCGDNNGNKDSASCGDCDYYSNSGTMCKIKEKGESVTVGNYLCKDLDCKDYRGLYDRSGTGHATASIYPRHGETWCATDNKNGAGLYSPGATSFRMICYNGEVTREECDSTRQKICFENVTDVKTGFRTANCGVNVWGDCWQQGTQKDCQDINARDCSWVALKGYSFSSDKGLIMNNSAEDNDDNGKGVCVPKFQPGFVRDGGETEKNVKASCGLSTITCIVNMKKDAWHSLFGGGDWECDHGLFGNKRDENNCSCVENDNKDYDKGKTWAESLMPVCVQMGDCGEKVNYIGEPGSVKISDAITITEVEEKKDE
jgi:hypothetical protein